MTWNRCAVCGKFVPYNDIAEGRAAHVLITPESDRSRETLETLCAKHANSEKAA